MLVTSKEGENGRGADVSPALRTCPFSAESPLRCLFLFPLRACQRCHAERSRCPAQGIRYDALVTAACA